jgi:hypothetical protein
VSVTGTRARFMPLGSPEALGIAAPPPPPHAMRANASTKASRRARLSVGALRAAVSDRFTAGSAHYAAADGIETLTAASSWRVPSRQNANARPGARGFAGSEITVKTSENVIGMLAVPGLLVRKRGPAKQPQFRSARELTAKPAQGWT